MTTFEIGLLYGGFTLLVMFSGMPIAFSLGLVATVFMVLFMPAASLDTVTQNVYEEMSSITLLSIPLFILKGAAIGRSPAGRDLYGAPHTPATGIANVFAWPCLPPWPDRARPPLGDRLAGIPEMRKRSYPGGFAAGLTRRHAGILLPPSITMILYAVAEQSLGRLFGGHRPGRCCWWPLAAYAPGVGYSRARRALSGGGEPVALLDDEHFTLGQKFAALPRVLRS
jgi:hypothetical protein